MMPVAAALSLRFDARALLIIGLVLFSGSCFLNTTPRISRTTTG